MISLNEDENNRQGTLKHPDRDGFCRMIGHENSNSITSIETYSLSEISPSSVMDTFENQSLNEPDSGNGTSCMDNRDINDKMTSFGLVCQEGNKDERETEDIGKDSEIENDCNPLSELNMGNIDLLRILTNTPQDNSTDDIIQNAYESPLQKVNTIDIGEQEPGDLVLSHDVTYTIPYMSDPGEKSKHCGKNSDIIISRKDNDKIISGDAIPLITENGKKVDNLSEEMNYH